MKILLLGKNGQVGWELQRALAPLGEVIALDRQSVDNGLYGDLALLDKLAQTVKTVSPDVIVNAAAYTSVDKAETEKDLAQTINSLAVEVLAKEALSCGAWLIHYSTDYVFDGSGNKAWSEDNVVAPLNVYGSTKLDGEKRIQATDCKHLIFRTSWVYSARGNNFAKTMLRLAKERDKLSVIDDQIGAPTGAELLADVTAHAIYIARQKAEVSGIYHLVASGKTSWHSYADYVLQIAKEKGISLNVEPGNIEAVPTSSFPTPATRPHNSWLNTEKLETTFNLKMPFWEKGVARMLDEILP